MAITPSKDRIRASALTSHCHSTCRNADWHRNACELALAASFVVNHSYNCLQHYWLEDEDFKLHSSQCVGDPCDRIFHEVKK